MTRALLAALCLLSCAHVTEPVSQAPNLAAWLSEPEAPKAAAAPDCTGTITLAGDIDPDSAEMLSAGLEACKDRVVVVEINSTGGSIFASWEMMKAIERHPHAVLCMVDGIAASAAFSILQACDVRTMTPRSILMAHSGSAASRGQAEAHENMARALRAINRSIAEFAARRMGMDAEEFLKRISGGKEWWFSLDDAKKFNAIDDEVSGLAAALEIAERAQKHASADADAGR